MFSGVPNLLSVVRIGLIPVFLYVATEIGSRDVAPLAWVRLAPAGVLLAIGLSDVLDGYLARRYGWVTRAGAILDALADKLAQLSAVGLLALVELPSFSPIPLWFLAALIVRDLILGVGWLLSIVHPADISVEHAPHGRFTTLCVFGVLVAILCGLPDAPLAYVLGLTVLLVGYSTTAYVRRAFSEVT